MIQCFGNVTTIQSRIASVELYEQKEQLENL